MARQLIVREFLNDNDDTAFVAFYDTLLDQYEAWVGPYAVLISEMYDAGDFINKLDRLIELLQETRTQVARKYEEDQRIAEEAQDD